MLSSGYRSSCTKEFGKFLCHYHIHLFPLYILIGSVRGQCLGDQGSDSFCGAENVLPNIILSDGKGITDSFLPHRSIAIGKYASSYLSVGPIGLSLRHMFRKRKKDCLLFLSTLRPCSRSVAVALLLFNNNNFI